MIEKIVDVETIYVDSASTDESVTTARNIFDTVICLQGSNSLCASLGRYWATRTATKKWILYLDGDMELRSEFIEFLENWNTLKNIDGALGQYIDVYEDGSQRHGVLAENMRNGITTHFGGAVLIRRESVVTAGNWNPYIFSNEEIELYARLKNTNCSIWYVDVPMVMHHTKRIPKWLRLIDMVIPRDNGLGKKYYGFGQLLASKIKHGGLCSFIRVFPYPFVFWAGVVMSLMVSHITSWYMGVAVFALTVAYVVLKKGFKFVALYTLLPIQTISGLFHYDESVLLTPTDIWRK